MAKKKQKAKKTEAKPKPEGGQYSQLMDEVSTTNPEFVEWLRSRKTRRPHESEK